MKQNYQYWEIIQCHLQEQPEFLKSMDLKYVYFTAVLKMQMSNEALGKHAFGQVQQIITNEDNANFYEKKKNICKLDASKSH